MSFNFSSKLLTIHICVYSTHIYIHMYVHIYGIYAYTHTYMDVSIYIYIYDYVGTDISRKWSSQNNCRTDKHSFMHNENKPKQANTLSRTLYFKFFLTYSYGNILVPHLMSGVKSGVKRQIGTVLFLLRLEVINYSCVLIFRV